MKLSRNINPMDQYQFHFIQVISSVPYLGSEEENSEQFSKEQLFNHSRTSDSGVWEAYIYGVVVQYITVAVQKYCVRRLWRYVYLFSFGVLRISNLH